MKQQIRFKVFSSADELDLERQLNTWAESLPEGAVVRRTQLSTGNPGYAAFVLYALVNYTVPVDDGKAPS